MEDYNKGSNKTTVTFIVLVLFILVCITLVMNKDMFNKELDKEENNEKVEVTKIDSNIKSQIKDKMAVLMFYMNTKYSDGVQGGYGFHTVLFKRDLTDTEKQAYVVKATGFQPLTLDYKNISEINQMISNDPTAKDQFSQVDAKVVDENYKNLFNDTIKTRATEMGNCPPIHYYEDINTYVSFPARCGGATDQFFLTYLDEMKQDGNTINVYMYLGNGKGDKVYADFDLASPEQAAQEEDANAIVPKKELDIKEKDTDDRPTINSKNKTKFSKYKFTFIDNGEGEYYFAGIEQVK